MVYSIVWLQLHTYKRIKYYRAVNQLFIAIISMGYQTHLLDNWFNNPHAKTAMLLCYIHLIHFCSFDVLSLERGYVTEITLICSVSLAVMFNRKCPRVTGLEVRLSERQLGAIQSVALEIQRTVRNLE